MRNVVDAPPEREAGDWRRSRGGSQEARSCLAASTLPSFMIRLLPPIRLYIPTVGVQQPSEYTGWDTGVADAHCGLGLLTPYVSPSGSLRVDEDGDRQGSSGSNCRSPCHGDGEPVHGPCFDAYCGMGRQVAHGVSSCNGVEKSSADR